MIKHLLTIIILILIIASITGICYLLKYLSNKFLSKFGKTEWWYKFKNICENIFTIVFFICLIGMFIVLIYMIGIILYIFYINIYHIL